MKLMENILQALSSLRANKMRALLTMLGIIIGIGSVIAIMTVGTSLTASMNDSMQSFGVNNITISLQSKQDAGRGMMSMVNTSYGGNAIDPKNFITDDMLDNLRREYPDEIEAISASESVGSGQTTQGRLYANLSLIGTSPEYAVANSLTMDEGRFIRQSDLDGAKKVCVVSEKLVTNMFPGRTSAIGQAITVQAGTHVGIYTIVGIYQDSGGNAMMFSTSSDRDTPTDVYIPLSVASKITGNQGYQSVTLLTAAGLNSTTFAEKAGAFLNRYYSRNQDWGVSAFSMESMMEQVTSMMGTVQLAISAIAAISLLVGGIGVMNIMLVSITERTREIGTRKALGATNTEIRMQFIVESIIICLIGGIIGIILGNLMGALGAQLLDAPAKTSISTMLIAAAFSMLVGMFFGYYPANKAAKMDPIDALRYE